MAFEENRSQQSETAEWARKAWKRNTKRNSWSSLAAMCSHHTRLEAIAIRLEAIAIRLEAIAIKCQVDSCLQPSPGRHNVLNFVFIDDDEEEAPASIPAAQAYVWLQAQQKIIHNTACKSSCSQSFTVRLFVVFGILLLTFDVNPLS